MFLILWKIMGNNERKGRSKAICAAYINFFLVQIYINILVLLGRPKTSRSSFYQRKILIQYLRSRFPTRFCFGSCIFFVQISSFHIVLCNELLNLLNSWHFTIYDQAFFLYFYISMFISSYIPFIIIISSWDF